MLKEWAFHLLMPMIVKIHFIRIRCKCLIIGYNLGICPNYYGEEEVGHIGEIIKNLYSMWFK